MKFNYIIFSLLFFSTLAVAQPDANELFAKADQLHQSKKYEKAIRILEEFITDHSKRKYDAALAYFHMSANYMQLREYDMALYSNEQSQILREDIGASESLIENRLRFGEIYLHQYKYEEALDHFYQAKEMEFDDPEVFANINYNLAQLLHILGKHQEAADYYDRTAQILSIEFGEDYEKLISIYLQQSRLALAMDNYQGWVDYSAKIKPLLTNQNIKVEDIQVPLLQTMAELSLGRYPLNSTSAMLRSLMFNALYLVRS